jgi:hypothetical protein
MFDIDLILSQYSRSTFFFIALALMIIPSPLFANILSSKETPP